MNSKMLISFLATSLAIVASAIEDKCETPLTQEELAGHWVACEGLGETKDKAIDKALKRGVSMVYGQIMSAEDKMESSSSEKTVSTPVGEASVEMSSESLASKMQTKTAGFVREYKVISVGTDNGGLVKAHVHARIVNPRAGVDGVIFVTRPDADPGLKAELTKIGSRVISGADLCKVAEGALCGALTGSKHFAVRTVKDLALTAANDAVTKEMVGAGMVPTSELLQAGQALTCDFILSTRLEKVSYSQKLGRDKKTKKMGKIRSMKIVLALQLTNVRTGVAAASDTVTLELDNSAIAELLEQDEDADLFMATFQTIVQPLRGWIKKSAK